MRAAPIEAAWYHDEVALRGSARTLFATALTAFATACGSARGTASSPVPPPAPSMDPLPVPPPAPELPQRTARNDAPGWLGVELAVASPGDAGVLVRDVLRGSPAARAGLVMGDRILRIDSEAVSRPPDVVRIVSSRQAGERVGLAFVRNGADRLVAVVLQERPDQDELMQSQFLGAPAPAWRPLATVKGSAPANLSELRGRVVVLEFWASWCVACRLSVPTLNAWKDRYGVHGLTVLGVTTDSPELALEAAVELGIDYPVLSDDDAETSRVYRAMSLPTLFIIDQQGVVRDVMVGYSSERLAQAEVKLQELVGVRSAPASLPR
jgi:thiol-disulfide isomerase/thioredoxin